NEGGTVEVKYEIKRAAGGTSYSDTLKFSVGVALDLKPPRIKEAPNDILQPIAAKETLTAVIPTFTNMAGKKISVDFIGTPGEGSQTVGPTDVTAQEDLEIPLDNSLVAFNLGKTVKVSYHVFLDEKLLGSHESQVTVQNFIAQDPNLPRPAIAGQTGTELNTGNLPNDAQVQIEKWPLQLLHQNIWLRYDGIDNDGNAIAKVFWAGAAHKGDDGLFYRAEVAWLRNLKDGSLLTITFKLNFDKVANDGRAVLFPLRTYTIKAIEEVVPIIDSVKGSSSNEDIPAGGQTVETTIILSGTATPDTKIDLANNGALMPNTEVQVDPLGEWTFRLTGLVAGNTYKLSARRKDGILSDARDVVVVALVVPTLDNVLDDKGIEVPDRQFTVSTQLKLKGTASYGQKVEIFEGDGPSHTSKGVATASTATGIWELPITVAVGARRLYAGSLYTPSLQWSNVRTLTVTEATAPTLDNVLDDKGVVVPKNTNTLSTSLTLKGSASIGQKVEIFDGTTSIGEVTATSGNWEKLITGLSLTSHTFTAKAVYGSGAVSTAWKVTVQAFTLDRSPMNLNGLCLILDPSSSPRWKKSGVVEPGTTQTRRPTVAAEPVSYASSNPSIASVDSSGKVTSVNKGKSIITVTDARLNSGTYEVNVTNVHRITIRRGTVTSAQGNAWIASVGGINGGEYVMNTLQRLCSNDGELGTHYTGSATQFYSLGSLSTQALLVTAHAGSDLSRDSAVAMIPV
ncbi:Ig-like domain-containing protein, partial [Pseudomonas sp. IT-P395]|uniref:Ig-like domain-containing protein n=1 Tax=Pseudomonas sp. IT-P395 TaxID=3026459 RepID=UPI0039DFB725